MTAKSRWVLALAFAVLAWGQATDRSAGTVTAIDQTAKQITIHTDAGSQFLVLYNGQTEFLRVAPGSEFSGKNPAGRPHDLQSMLGRMPVFMLAELKAGDALAVAGTKGAEESKITAITILAGVEPLLTAGSQGGGRNSMNSWNLDLNLNMDLP